MRKIVLASASPRRRELLSKVGITFEVKPASGEERITSTEPSKVVEELSFQKAMFTAHALEKEQADDLADILIIGAMLSMLQGNTHQVYTGVTVLVREEENWKVHTFHECTDVIFYPVTKEEIAEYVNSKDPMDKAGSYGIQGAWGAYVKGIRGDYNNVVGLPVARLIYETKKLGINLRG